MVHEYDSIDAGPLARYVVEIECGSHSAPGLTFQEARKYQREMESFGVRAIIRRWI